MKRAFQLLGIVIIIFSISSCGMEKNNDPKDISQALIKKLYSVDKNTVDSFPIPSISAESANAISESQRMTDAFESLHTKFKPFVTESYLKSIIANRFYSRNVKSAIQNKCTLTCGTVSLTQAHILEGYQDFNFTVEVVISFNDGRSNQIETEKGFIAASNENGAWKVSFIRIDSHSDFLSN